jgi:hypothetical protein
VVAVVAVELEERIRRGMWCGLLMVRVRRVVLLLPRTLVLLLLLPLPLPLLMLVLGRRVVIVLLLMLLMFMLMLKDRLDLRGW